MVEEAKGSEYPTLIKHYESDEDLDAYVIEHAYMFTVVQIRPGGFVNGHGSNYIREEVPTLEAAQARAKEIYDADPNKRSILIYAVANFAGAQGFNRPVKQYPPSTYRSKADLRRDEERARRKRREAKEAKAIDKKATKLTAAIFTTSFEKPVTTAVITDEDFASSATPMVKVVRL